ncbi:MAG: hypothetical protein K2X27_23445 [Candidatus Obscuribacterales bacterium]|nr:hypothetical protein [Candidatus Obscuribacterales bacterium]
MSDGEVSKIIHKGSEGLKHLASDASEALKRLQEHALPHQKEAAHQQPKLKDASLKSKGLLPGLEIEDRTHLSDELTGRKSSGAGAEQRKPATQHRDSGKSHTSSDAQSNQHGEKKPAHAEPNHPSDRVMPGNKDAAAPKNESKSVSSHSEQAGKIKNDQHLSKTSSAVDNHAQGVDGKTYLKSMEEYGIKLKNGIEQKLHALETPKDGGFVKLKGQDEYMARREKARPQQSSGAPKMGDSRSGDPFHEKQASGKPHSESRHTENAPSESTNAKGAEAAAKSGEIKPVEKHTANTNQAEPLTLRSVTGKVFNTGFGALSVIGGYYETKEGISDLRNGKYLDGALKTSAGVADTGSGFATIAYGFGKKALGSVAGKLGGAGALLSGATEGIQGIKENDTEKKVEGGVKVVLGAGMFASGSTAPLSGAGLAGWGAGRFIGTHAGWGGENIDTKTTRFIDSHLNQKLNDELAQTSSANLQLLDKQQGIIGKELFSLQAEGANKKDVSEAIIGLREKLESERAKGNDTKALQDEVKRLIDMRSKI